MNYAYVKFLPPPPPSAVLIPHALPARSSDKEKDVFFAVSTVSRDWFWFCVCCLVCYCLVLPIYFSPVLFSFRFIRVDVLLFLVGFLDVLCGGCVVGIHARIDFGLHTRLPVSHILLLRPAIHRDRPYFFHLSVFNVPLAL
jgi:hypothetical protein